MKRFLKFLLALTFLVLFVSCEQGTESGTETNLQGIKGQIQRDGNLGVSGAVVYSFRHDPLNAQPDSVILLRFLQNPDTLKDSIQFRSTHPNSDGAYQFKELHTGNYGILAIYSDSNQKGNWVGFNPSIIVSEKKVTEAGILTLRLLGGISAVVFSEGQESLPLENVTCHIPGLSYVAFTDSQGKCSLLNIPEGFYLMAFDQYGYTSQKIGPIRVESGVLSSISKPIRLVRDPSGPPPAPKGLSISKDNNLRIVTLDWDSVSVSDVVGYVIYRRPIDSIINVVESPLRKTLIRNTFYTDTLYKTLSDTAGITYLYRIATMDAEGNLSSSTLFPPMTIQSTSNPIRIQFTQSEFSGIEGENTLISKVSRLGPKDRAVTVKWKFENSSAERNSDFVSMTGELTFAPGDSTQILPALLIDDPHVENSETFFAELFDPSNGAVLGEPSITTLKIQDDDSLTQITCVQPSQGIHENDSTTIILSRSGDITRRASVHYEFSADSKTSVKPNIDFLPNSGTVEFGSGLKTIRIPIPLVDDTLEEKSEKIFFRISLPSPNVNISNCPEMNIEILDNDTNYTVTKIDISKATLSHNGIRSHSLKPFPHGLYDMDTTISGLGEYKSSNPDLVAKPIAHWNFKDCGKKIVRDLSGNGFDGTVTGSLDCKSDSTHSQVSEPWAQFNHEDMVTIADRPDFNFGQSLTVTALIRPDSLNFLRTIIGKLYYPTAFSLGISDGKFDFNLVIEDGTETGRSYNITAPAQLGKWTHVAGTYDGTTARLFLDGEWVMDIPVSGKLKITERPITIGNFPEWNKFAGGIKEVKLFKQALNAMQIKEQIDFSEIPANPLEVTLTFPEPIWTQGSSIYFSSELGTKNYTWTLAAANSIVDFVNKNESYTLLKNNSQTISDTVSHAFYKPQAFKYFRFVVTGLSGTGFIQINELSLLGAERIKF